MPKLLRRVTLSSLMRVNKMLNTLRRVTSEGSLKLPNFQVSPQRGLQLELK